jgi:membrane-associated phospholipid phosphatase
MSRNLAQVRQRSALHLRRLRSTMHKPTYRLHALVETPWPASTTWVLGVLWICGVLLFLVLAIIVHRYGVLAIDRQINAAVQELEGTPVTPFGKSLGDLAGPVAATVQYVIVLGLFAVFRFLRELLCVAVSGLGAETMNIVTNTIVARPRPPSYHGTTLFNLGSHSFPSGHTANAVGLYGFLFFLAVLAQHAYPKWKLWLLGAEILCIYFVIDVGVSRILETQHWPSDVLGGYLLGALMLTVGIALYHWLAVRAATHTRQHES